MYFHTGPCPTVLVQLSGGAKTHQGKYAGVYALRDGRTTNSREDWISQDGKYAIWYEGGDWAVGTVSQRGSNTAAMFTKTKLTAVDPSNKWTYDNKKRGWVESDEVQVFCGM